MLVFTDNKTCTNRQYMYCIVHDFYHVATSAHAHIAHPSTDHVFLLLLKMLTLKRKAKVDTGGADFSTPTRRYRFSRGLLVDDFDRKAIRRKTYRLYQTKGHVTLPKLLLLLKRDNLFRGQRSALNILLEEMGFK